MNRYFSLTVLALFLSLILLPSSISGQRFYGPEEEAVLDSPRELDDLLGLTPEQKVKLEEFMISARERQRAHFESMRKLQLEMRDMMQDPEANEKEILALYDQMARLRAEQFRDSLQRRKEYRKILTPEQIEKLEMLRSRVTRGREMVRGPFMRGRGFARQGRFFRPRGMDFYRRGGARLRARPFMFRRWWRW